MISCIAHPLQGTTVKVQFFKRAGEAWFRIMEDKSQIMQAKGVCMGSFKNTEAMVVELAQKYVSGQVPRVALKKLKSEKEAEFSAAVKKQGAAPPCEDKPAMAAKTSKRTGPKEREPNKKPKRTAASVASSTSGDRCLGGLFGHGVPLTFDEEWNEICEIQPPSEED